MHTLPLDPDQLGESIGWHAKDGGELWRVDVSRGVVHRVETPLADTPRQRTERFEGEVGFALPRHSGGMVVGAERTLWLLNADGSRRALLELDERPANRWNDAACDGRGRLWAGTFARDHRLGAANLYRVDPDGSLERVLRDLTNSNGLGWLDAGCRLHLIDSPRQKLESFDVDPDAGKLRARRTVTVIPTSVGMPDGLCVDREGGTWVALYGGGRVRRYDREGGLDEEIEIPAPHVTNACLGGPRGSQLFVTTARHRLAPAHRRRFPDAGCVFYTDVAVAGDPLARFGG